MQSKQEDVQFFLSDVTDIERDFGYISTMLRWKETCFFGPRPRGYYQAADFFSEYSTQRLMVRQRQTDVTIIAYAEFSYFPLIRALPPDCWTHWLKKHFCINGKDPLTWGDTMFFTRFIYFPKYNPALVNFILKEFFHRQFKVRHVVVLQMPEEENALPEDIPCYDMLNGLCTVLYPRTFSVHTCRNVQRLHIIHRDNVIERMRFRKALPEDNDDIVPVIDVDHPELRKEYGDFYIAEELQRQQDENDTHNTFIVCELKHETAGFIWLNDDVNISTLVHNFECEGFGNMLKFSNEKPFLEKEVNVSEIKKTPCSALFTSKTIDEIYKQDLDKLISKNSVRCNRDLTCKRPSCPVAAARSQMDYDASETDVEYFRLREEFLRKMQLIETHLISTEHYHKVFRKRLCISCNVRESIDTSAVDLPFDAYSNVFAIKMLGLSKTTDIRFASRFIASAFAAYPERDYCLISLPSKAAGVSRSVAMLDAFFVNLAPRPDCKIADHVFVIDRSTIFGYIGVMNALPEDIESIERIIENSIAMFNKRASTTYQVSSASLSTNDMAAEGIAESTLINNVLWDVFNNANSEYHFLTIRCGDSQRPMEFATIVGFVIVRPFYRQSELDYKYNFLNSEMNFKQIPGEIVLLRLHPCYIWQSDTIFHHISSATGFWEFYHMKPIRNNTIPLTNDLVKQMQPIEPKCIAKIHRKDFLKSPSQCSEGKLDENGNNFAIYYHNLLPSKLFENSKPIIVIGFSSMTRALLRCLLFNFTKASTRNGHCCQPRFRVTIIAQTGVVEGAYDNSFTCDVCENQADCYINFENVNSFLRDTTLCMDFRKYFCFVSAGVERINREKRTVELTNGCVLYYQNLILSLPERFGLPATVSHTDSLPINYMHINERFDKIKLYHKIAAINTDRNANDIHIIVFGAHLNTFECINFLITHKVTPQSITLVVPWNSKLQEDYNKYNFSNIDLNLELILQQMVEDLGVKLETQWLMKKIIYYANEEITSHVVFEHYRDGNHMTLPCDLLISFHCDDIGGEIQQLITQSGIEIDGTSVLIDENYRTSDPNIYAIGNFIRLRNTPNHQYKHVAEEEVASKLIYCLQLNEDEDTEYSVKFSKAVYFQAQLPLGHYMVKVILPKRYLANHLDNNYCISLVTYDNGNFSRVRLNDRGVAEEITCVTKDKRTFDHLQYFVGQHESLLNNLYSRWYLNEIPSFVDFFEQPWTELLMHSNYDELRLKINALTMDAVKNAMLEHPDMERRERKEYLERYMEDHEHTLEVEKTLLRFLRKHREDFVHAFALPEDFHLNLAEKLNI